MYFSLAMIQLLVNNYFNGVARVRTRYQFCFLEWFPDEAEPGISFDPETCTFIMPKLKLFEFVGYLCPFVETRFRVVGRSSTSCMRPLLESKVYYVSSSEITLNKKLGSER